MERFILNELVRLLKGSAIETDWDLVSAAVERVLREVQHLRQIDADLLEVCAGDLCITHSGRLTYAALFETEKAVYRRYIKLAIKAYRNTLVAPDVNLEEE